MLFYNVQKDLRHADKEAIPASSSLRVTCRVGEHFKINVADSGADLTQLSSRIVLTVQSLVCL
jgi:hypothetical protein